MKDRNYLTNKQIMQRHKIATDESVKCKCGHSILITNRYGKVICNYCGRLVFRNKKEEFEYRLKERLLKDENMVHNRKK